MSALTFPTGTYHFNNHPLFDFQLNRVVMWNHGDPAEVQARGGEITDFPSWERVLKEFSAQAEARADWAAAAGYLRMAEFFMAPDTLECHTVYDRAREIFYTHFAHLFAEKGGPIYREEVPYEGGVLPCWRILPDGVSKGTILFHGGNDSLLEEFPGAKQIAAAHLTRLKALLETASKGRYKRDMALEIRNAARNSVGSRMPAKSLELQHTIRLIRELNAEITEIEEQIQSIMDELHSPIPTIPGLGFRMAAMILAEVGDFTRFDSPDKLLAYAGMSPSTYQSGQLKNCYSHMEKRGSRYLRYALYNATKYVCHWDPAFATYLAKKRAEGKHYNVALPHAARNWFG